MKSGLLVCTIALGVVALAACGSPGRGTPGAPMVTPLSLGPPPIYALLGYRRELALTSAQVTALDSIATSVQESNRPLISDLQRVSRDRPRQPGFIELTPEGEPILEEIRANQRDAAEAVAAVLTEEQRGTVCRLFDPARRNPNAQRQRPAPQRARGDTVRTQWGDGLGGWAWCAAAEAAVESA